MESLTVSFENKLHTDAGTSDERQEQRELETHSLPSATHRRSVGTVILYASIVGAWLAFLGVGCLGYLYTVLPLKEQILAQEVRSVALALDATIRERCLVVDTIAGNMEMEAFLKQGAMANIVKRMKGTFPDFLALQVVDQHGTIIATAGDILLQDGVLPSNVKIDWAAGPSSLPGGWQFGEGPATNQWDLTCRHSGSRVGTWFVRATFSRGPLQNAAARAGLKSARPFSLSRLEGPFPSEDYGVEAGSSSLPVWISDRRWMAATRAEAPMTAGGWLVRLDDEGLNSTLIFYPALAAGLLLFCTIGTLAAVGRSARRNDGPTHPGPRSTPPSAADYAAVSEDGATIDQVEIEKVPDLVREEMRTEEKDPDEPIIAMAAPDDIPEVLEVAWDEPIEQSRGPNGSANDDLSAGSPVPAGM